MRISIYRFIAGRNFETQQTGDWKVMQYQQVEKTILGEGPACLICENVKTNQKIALDALGGVMEIKVIPLEAESIRLMGRKDSKEAVIWKHEINQDLYQQLVALSWPEELQTALHGFIDQRKREFLDAMEALTKLPRNERLVRLWKLVDVDYPSAWINEDYDNVMRYLESIES